jgi:hypothetical protein
MTATADIAPALRTAIDQFGESLAKGVDALVDAARIYVQAIDADPTAADAFAEHYDGTIDPSSWSAWERVGRKQMHLALLLGNGGPHGNRIMRLPYSTQERIYNGERFPLLIDKGEHILLDLRHASMAQASQLLDADHIRSLPEQRAYLEAIRARPAPPEEAETLPYIIRGGKVLFRKGTELTKEQIRRILQEI